MGYETGVEGFWTEVDDQFGTAEAPPVDPDGSDGSDASAPSDGAPSETETQAIDDGSVTHEIGPDVEDTASDDAETREAEPRASRGRTSTQTVTTRTTHASGCSSGNPPAGGSFLMCLLLALVGLTRTRER